MEHVAIMKKEWKLTQKVIDGVKTIESRWYKSKITPWNKIKKGDLVYFKDSSSYVVVKATVSKVDQHEIKNNTQGIKLMGKYALEVLGSRKLDDSIKKYIKDKKYAIFIHIIKVKKVSPFDIDKTGFGTQRAWITLDSVKSIKKDL